jgi:hypothetical protein
MSDLLHYSGTDFLAHERIGDLRSTAHELHGLPKAEGRAGQHGRIHRVRTTVGRWLVSVGSAVSGHRE